MENLTDEVEMAGQLKVTRRTLRNWRYLGIVPYLKVGHVIRFSPQKVFKALAQYERIPAATKGAK
jgi:hypothetical protein